MKLPGNNLVNSQNKLLYYLSRTTSYLTITFSGWFLNIESFSHLSDFKSPLNIVNILTSNVLIRRYSYEYA